MWIQYSKVRSQKKIRLNRHFTLLRGWRKLSVHVSYYDVSRSMGRIERGPRHVILDEIYLIHLPSAIGSSASAAALTGDHSSAASPSVLRRASRATDVHALQLRGTDDSEHEPESFGVRRLPSNVVRWVSQSNSLKRPTYLLQLFFQPLVLLLPSLLSLSQIRALLPKLQEDSRVRDMIQFKTHLLAYVCKN